MGMLPEFGNLFFTLAAFVVALSIIEQLASVLQCL